MVLKEPITFSSLVVLKCLFFSCGTIVIYLATLEATLVLSPERVVYGQKFSCLWYKRARNQSQALFFQPIRDAVVFDVFQFYIKHVFHLVRHLLTISSNNSWPKEFLRKTVFLKTTEI